MYLGYALVCFLYLFNYLSIPLFIYLFIHCHSFEINLKTGESDLDDIAFHFNPRIGQYVYLNSFRNGGWDKEACASDKPFIKGAAFYMFVVINSHTYEASDFSCVLLVISIKNHELLKNTFIIILLQVYVNGLKHCTFKHSIPLEKVSTLGIRGDVSKLIYGFIDVCSIIVCANCWTVLSGLTVLLMIIYHLFIFLIRTGTSHIYVWINQESQALEAHSQAC